ncbi:hypothetical protein [Hymenobacter bucti]|uniref:Cupin domain-containing protein n=1 Tax=Hymenobacter bucti TaxID=1844114 RepID=A0ABW4QPH8_9BACT
MKTYLLSPATRQLALIGGVSCLVGWVVGSASGLQAAALAAAATAPATTPAAGPWPYPDSLDAVVAAPQFHRVLFENERVRVLEVTVPPHTREPLHTHRWPSVLYKEQTGRGRYYDATGALVHESTTPYRKGPDLVRARWQAPEAPHAVENTDEVADRFVRVELKQ